MLFHALFTSDATTQVFCCFNPQMLLKSIEQIADEKWTVVLVHEFEGQIALYEKLPDERVSSIVNATQ